MAARLGGRILQLLCPVLTAGAAIVVAATALAAQLPSAKPVDLPKGPAKAGFDISRFSSGRSALWPACR
jgi:predicted signal transduction protein with EAL and GGDEF domain